MATLKQIRDQVIIDTQVEGSPLFPEARLNRIINLAQRYVQVQLNGLGMKKWETSDVLTLSNSIWVGYPVKTANLSTDCSNMLEMPGAIKYIETFYGEAIIYGLAKEMDDRKFFEQISNTYNAPTYKQPAFMRLANKIYIYPSVDGATAYYYKAVADLTTDAANTEIPLEFEDFVIKRAVLEVNTINEKIQDKELALKNLEKEILSTHEKHYMKISALNEVSKKDNAKLQ